MKKMGRACFGRMQAEQNLWGYRDDLDELIARKVNTGDVS